MDLEAQVAELKERVTNAEQWRSANEALVAARDKKIAELEAANLYLRRSNEELVGLVAKRSERIAELEQQRDQISLELCQAIAERNKRIAALRESISLCSGSCRKDL